MQLWRNLSSVLFEVSYLVVFFWGGGGGYVINDSFLGTKQDEGQHNQLISGNELLHLTTFLYLSTITSVLLHFTGYVDISFSFFSTL